MSDTILLAAKPGYATLINSLFSAELGDKLPLIFDRKVIEQHVCSIQNGTDWHRAYLKPIVKTVADWNDRFPLYAENHGAIFLSNYDNHHSKLTKLFTFLRVKSVLFSKIENIGDLARRFGAHSVQIAESLGAPFSQPACFDRLPAHSSSQIYRLCKSYHCPTLWEAYINYSASSTYTRWQALKVQTVPWSGDLVEDNVWGLCEKAATSRDGIDYGLQGRYLKGVTPSRFEVHQALLSAYLAIKPLARETAV